MAMTPNSEIAENSLSDSIMTSKTYHIDFERKCVDGMCDNEEAVMQAIYKIIFTERYKFNIYDRSYGTEIKELIGKSPVYVSAVLKNRIEEAVLQDDRIKGIEEFSVSSNGGNMTAEFTAKTVFGDENISYSLPLSF